MSQAETPLPEYERQVDIYNEAIELARNQLAALAGAGPGAGESLTRPVLSLATPLGLPSALPAELVGHRPDVVAARWMVAAQARGIDVAKARVLSEHQSARRRVTQMSAGGALLTFLGGNGDRLQLRARRSRCRSSKADGCARNSARHRRNTIRPSSTTTRRWSAR